MEEREIKEQALVLRNEDCGDADRVVTLLTLSHGKIRAKMKGVKKPRAKLAYASFPFNFGEYLLVKRGRSYTVTNCGYVDNFAQLTADLNKYYAGAGMLEVADSLTREGGETLSLFMSVVRGLKLLAYEKDANIFSVLAKFLVEAVEYGGFSLGVDKNLRMDAPIYFDFSLGKLTGILGEDAVELEQSDAKQLQNLIKTDAQDFDFKTSSSKTIVKLLILFFENKVDEEIKIFKKFV